MVKRSTAKRHAPANPAPAQRHTETIGRFKADADVLCARPVTTDSIDLALTYWIGYPNWLLAIRGRRLLEDDAGPDWLYLEEQHLANVHQCALEALAAAAQAAGLQSDAIYESGQWCRRLCAAGKTISSTQWPTAIPSTSAPAEVLGIVDRGYHQLLRLTNRATLPAAPGVPLAAAEKSTGKKPVLTEPLTKAKLGVYFTCHRNSVKAKVLDEYPHEIIGSGRGAKYRMHVANMPPAYHQEHAKAKP